MDKGIWLRVIREELAILEQLAIGMIEDANLYKDEVELAITRSKIVVQEFEMLLHNIPHLLQEEVAQKVIEKVVTEAPAQAVLQPDSPPVPESGGLLTAIQERPHSSLSPDDHAGTPMHLPIPESPHTPVPPSPRLPVSESPFIHSPEPYEQNMLKISDQIDVPSQFKALPLKSLKEGVSLNDRYLFQRELFDNDKSKLDETVATLDRFSNIREAVDYLKANFKWTKSEASEKFVQLVKRRFS